MTVSHSQFTNWYHFKCQLREIQHEFQRISRNRTRYLGIRRFADHMMFKTEQLRKRSASQMYNLRLWSNKNANVQCHISIWHPFSWSHRTVLCGFFPCGSLTIRISKSIMNSYSTSENCFFLVLCHRTLM